MNTSLMFWFVDLGQFSGQLDWQKNETFSKNCHFSVSEGRCIGRFLDKSQEFSFPVNCVFLQKPISFLVTKTSLLYDKLDLDIIHD